jgi:hypothetical protein
MGSVVCGCAAGVLLVSGVVEGMAAGAWVVVPGLVLWLGLAWATVLLESIRVPAWLCCVVAGGETVGAVLWAKAKPLAPRARTARRCLRAFMR